MKAYSDNHPAGFTDEPVYGEPRPLVKSAPGEKEGGGEVVCQVSKIAAAILAQLAQELPQLGGGEITQLDFLGREFGSRAFGKRICSAQDVIEQREGCLYLEVMGSTSAASRPLVELPCSLPWQGFQDQALSGRPDFMAVGPVAAPGAGVERSGVFADCF